MMIGWRDAFKTTQKTIGEVTRGKDELKSGAKSPTTKAVESSLIASQKSGPKELDAKIASFFYENAISFNIAASSSFALLKDECIKFAKQNPLRSYNVPHCVKFSGELLDQAYASTEKLVAPVLAVAKNMEQQSHWMYGATCRVGPF